MAEFRQLVPSSIHQCRYFSGGDGKFWYLKVYFILTVFGVLILKFFRNTSIGSLGLYHLLLYSIFFLNIIQRDRWLCGFYLRYFNGNRMRGKNSTKMIPVLYTAVAGFNMDVLVLRKRYLL
jgi:hypothetical protein